jgi:uncharacterized Ntn-hydrolase superfamily protein
MATQMTRIVRMITDLIRANPFDPRHPRAILLHNNHLHNKTFSVNFKSKTPDSALHLHFYHSYPMKTKPIKIFCLFVFLFMGTCFRSFGTWSIIVIDPKTKEIGIAGASCTVSVYGIGLIVPGKGAIVVQAMSNSLARLQGFRMIMDGSKPADILEKLRHPDFFPEQQQYSIACLNDFNHPATYTGKENTSYAGTLTGNGISVQGNTLTNPEEIQAIFDAAVKAQKASLPIQDILMIALEAGAKAGGDKRCGDRKASSAFLIVSKSYDVEKHWLNLVISGTDDKIHAVDALRQKFDSWKAAGK